MARYHPHQPQTLARCAVGADGGAPREAERNVDRNNTEDNDMALIVRVEITDDATGEVKQTFVEKYDGRDSWDEAHAIRRLMESAFKIEFGPMNEEWA